MAGDVRAFEVGKAYVIHDARCSAHFTATVVRRTRCTVTFELGEAGRRWLRDGSVTLRVSDRPHPVEDAHGRLMERVRGTHAGRALVSVSGSER